MKLNRTLVYSIGGILLVIVVVIVLRTYTQVQSYTALKPLTISYSTVASTRPEGAACFGDGEDMPRVAKELLNLETGDIYLAGGPKEIPDDAWVSTGFNLPLFKNSTRNLLFDDSCFFRSPDAAADCVGDACFTMEELSGYTWLKLTTIVGQSCFPDASGCSGDVVNAGYLSVNTIDKCQEITYSTRLVNILSDGTGNRYVMHATGTGTPDLTSPTLPAGWTLEAVPQDDFFIINPFGGGSDCYYNIVRDNLVQSYHQFEYAGATYP